jgi:hypothetical protein
MIGAPLNRASLLVAVLVIAGSPKKVNRWLLLPQWA